MPLAAQSLTTKSSSEDIRNAVSKSIAACVKEGKPQAQCIAIAYRYAEGATGRSLGREVQNKKVSVIT